MTTHYVFETINDRKTGFTETRGSWVLEDFCRCHVAASETGTQRDLTCFCQPEFFCPSHEFELRELRAHRSLTLNRSSPQEKTLQDAF